MKLVSRILLTVLLGCGGVLVALGPRPQRELPPDVVRITYWEKWANEQADAMRLVVDEFNRTVGRDKGIFVEYLSIMGVDRKTLASTAAGVPPDIAGLWQHQVAPFAARNAAISLDQLATSHGIRAEHYKPVYWELGHYDEMLYALPTTPGVCALIYNKQKFYAAADALRAAGLDPTRPPDTIEELDRYAQVLDQPSADGKRVEVAGYLPMEPGWWVATTPAWFGGRQFDPLTQRYTLDTPASVRAFDWIASYSRRLGKDAMTEFRSGVGAFNSPQNPFMLGTLAMIQQGPWMANYVRHNRPEMSQALVSFELEPLLPRIVRPFNYDWGVAAFPSAVPGLTDVTIADCDVLMIPRGARHPREAFEFIAYVQRQDVMERLCSLHCKHSPLAEVSETFLRKHPNPYIDVFERLARSPNAGTTAPIPIQAQVTDEMTVVGQKVSLLQETPEQALRAAQARIDGKLDQYLDQRAERDEKR
jgi:ABC-type glycerol-3-phosphate transport system substrate-binding protein